MTIPRAGERENEVQPIRRPVTMVAWSLPPVPFPTTRLIGRGAELERARDLLGRSDVRLITTTGPGGIGKTRLAIEIAHEVQLRDVTRVAFIPLDTVVDASGVLPAMVHALGLRDRGGGTDTIARALAAHRPLLLVLDNFEHVLGARTLVAALLATVPDLRILITSRVPLRLRGEHRLPVTLLTVGTAGLRIAPSLDDLPAAQHLFIDHARATRPDLRLDLTALACVDRICRRLDGLPLAIELAAARVSFLPLAELERQLHDGDRTWPRVLSDGPWDAPLRHRTLSDTIAWSYDLLSADEQRLFRHLALFLGGFSTDAVAGVVPESPDASPDAASAAGDGLRRLVDASLVSVDPDTSPMPRYRLLETIRSFAADRLRDSGEYAGASARHARWYLELAEEVCLRQFSPRLEAGILRLAPDDGNLRAAGDWFAANDAWAELVRLVAALAPAWWMRGDWAVTLPWLDRVWSDPRIRSATTPGQRVAIGTVLGLISAARRDRTGRAVAILGECVDLARRGDDDLATIRALIGLGWARGLDGDPDAGTVEVAEALRLARSLPEDAEVLALTSFALNNLGTLAHWVGRLTLAARRYDEGYDLLVRVGHAAGCYVNRIDRALIAGDMGELDVAWSLFRDALIEQPQRSDHRFVVICLEGLATVAVSLGHHALGGRLFGAADHLSELSGFERNGFDRPRHDAAITTVQSTLGRDGYQHQYAAGYAAPLDEIVRDVLAIDSSAAPSPSMVPAGPDTTAPTMFTPREWDVLRRLLSGWSNRRIADDLFVSVRTVEGHLVRIFGKLDVSSRAEAIVAAGRLGLALSEPALAPAVDEDVRPHRHPSGPGARDQ